MTEFAVSLLFVIAVLGGSAKLFRAEWNRARCAYGVFENAHARLCGGVRAPAAGIIVDESRDRIDAEGICGEAHEHVTLERLDPQ